MNKSQLIKDDPKEIIKNSGNNFHIKVLNYLKEQGWTTLISPYYTDNITSKPREIDIIAEKAISFDNIYKDIKGTISLKLFIECKYISRNTVFWFGEKDYKKAKSWVIKNTPHNETTAGAQNLHYLSEEKVAKLFAGHSDRKTENEPIFSAINQSLNAMVYNKRKDSIISNHTPISTVEYPIIVCNSFNKFFGVDIDDSQEPEEIKDNFQLEVNYAYLDYQKKQKNEYFLIDVIDFTKINEFLNVLDQDFKSIKNVVKLAL